MSACEQLPWADWRFFCLQLFGCKDEPHVVGGLQLDGKLKGASVLVFNHHEQPGACIDEETVKSIHAAIGKKIGRKFYIIAPRGVFGFQQDYIDLDGVRYYAMRVPYSIINELHQREFTALRQPNDSQHARLVLAANRHEDLDDAGGPTCARARKNSFADCATTRSGRSFRSPIL